MFSFKPNEKISDKNFLFGRNKSFQPLDVAVNTILRGTNCQLQGERRFGKTSILNCLHEEFKNDSKPNFIPFFFDFKKDNSYRGTANVYRFIISKVISELTRMDFIDKPLIIRDVEIELTPYLEHCYSKLALIDDYRIQGILEDLIIERATFLEANFIFIIDEYEYLMTKSLDKPEGFVTIRNLSEYSRQFGFKPLTYIISGSKSWDELCTEIGSPELNNQGSSIIYVGALDQEDFFEMLKFYYSDFTDIPLFPNLEPQKLFELSGGVPYYAKKIGESCITSKIEKVTYQLLKSDFESIFSNLNENELRIVYNISKSNYITDSNTIYNLEDRGIVKRGVKTYNINGELLKKFFEDKFIQTTYFVDSGRFNSIESYVDDIFDLIELINRNYKSRTSKDYLFEPTISENSQRATLKSICKSLHDFKSFINCIYTVLYERTAENSNKKARIPSPLKIHQFVSVIDSLRQEYHHLTESKAYKLRPGQKSRGEIYDMYLGHKSEPDPSEYSSFQVQLLQEFKGFLTQINSCYSKL